MSKEEKTPTESHQDKVIKLLEGLNRNIENLNTNVTSQLGFQNKPITTSSPTTPDSKPSEHWKAEDLTDDCPECKREKEKIAHQYLVNLRKEREKEPVVCKTCGTGVKVEEENCPLCGGKEARNR